MLHEGGLVNRPLAAQVYIYRGRIGVIESVRQVKRSEYGIGAEKDAARQYHVVQADIISIIPDVAGFHREPGVHRQQGDVTEAAIQGDFEQAEVLASELPVQKPRQVQKTPVPEQGVVRGILIQRGFDDAPSPDGIPVQDGHPPGRIRD